MTDGRGEGSPPPASRGPDEPVARPSRQDLAAAYGRTIPDVIAPGLAVLFVGINPGLYSGATGHHFARPGNRFWRALSGAGFTDRVLSPFEDSTLPMMGLGITNLVDRATARADELGADELRRGAVRLEAKAATFSPRFVAVVGVTAYRTAFGRRRAAVGAQEERIAGSGLWILPNPSGLNANHQLPDLVATFAELRAAVERDRIRG